MNTYQNTSFVCLRQYQYQKFTEITLRAHKGIKYKSTVTVEPLITDTLINEHIQ
jgi:hypothetical protein